MLVASRRLSTSVWSTIQSLFLDFTYFIAKNVFSHTHVFPNVECILVRKQSLLTNFHTLSTIVWSNAVNIVHFY